MSGKEQGLSVRAVELASQFLKNTPDATPGGLLEVAALIEGFLTGRFRVKYRSEFDPIKEGDDVFSLFSHVRAVVIDPGKPFESFVEKYDRLSEEMKTLIQENHTLGKTCSSLTGDAAAMKRFRDMARIEAKEAKGEKRKLEEELAKYKKAVEFAIKVIAVCVPSLIGCVVAIIWVMFLK